MTETLYSTIMDNIMLPLIVALGALIIVVIKGFTDKIGKSIIAKNEAESIKQKFSAKSYLIEQISEIVKSNVASNMPLSNYYKEMNRSDELTREQGNELKNNAIKLIMASLPGDVNDPNSEIYKLVGGNTQLETLIDSLLEKYVYEYNLEQEKNKCNI